MPTAFDEAFRRVKELVGVFKANEAYYRSPQFSEAQARKDFIDKFFIALGWDVNHDTQKNPYEQEVKIEKNESGTQRRADYAFFLAPKFRDVQFFVEAKKPENNFSPDDYFQTIRHGWGNTPLSVITNFREFQVLDCRYKPHIHDILNRIIKRFGCEDYTDADKFAEIYWLFSREAVAADSIAKRAAELPRPKSRIFRRELFKGGGQTPNEAFLIELDTHREMLAKAFKRKNPALTGEQLTEIVQRTLDRLVFVRFLEDKQIEPQYHVERFGAEGRSAWQDFVDLSGKLDRIYNGVVFKRHEILDAPGLQIDEKPFRIICEGLSDSTSPYNFASIPIHILGSIYERFLGKIITDGARVVEKPEVRKAGGVYYTPEYIVRYIVANTVGKAIEGKTPAEIAGMKFADIACGSGSFLIEVFDALLRWHAKFYNENPGKAKKGDCVKRHDGLHLSLKKKQEILRNNIYGVDIDPQAVEVAQLSLYLKLLEDETIGSAAEFQNEFHFTLLPSLADNVVCGNSLIGTDIEGTFRPEDERKLNPMDFAQRFPAIFRRRQGNESQTLRENSETPHVVSCDSGELREAVPGEVPHNVPGGMPLHGSYAKVSYRESKKSPARPEEEYEGGFDAIVGNPPYVLLQIFEQRPVFNYIGQKFSAARYKIDTYHVFLEQALRLTKENGFVGYITPNSFLRNKHAKELRRFVLNNSEVQILRLFYFGVFDGASVDTCVLTANRMAKPDMDAEVSFMVSRAPEELINIGKQAQKIWLEHSEFQFSLPGQSGAADLEAKIKSKSIALGEIATAYFGIQTFDRAKYVRMKSSQGFKPVIDGEHIERYLLHIGSEFVDFRAKAIKSGGKMKFINKTALVFARLVQFQWRLFFPPASTRSTRFTTSFSRNRRVTR
jgi:type I restriction-modification system DNA methylase subunit